MARFGIQLRIYLPLRAGLASGRLSGRQGQQTESNIPVLGLELCILLEDARPAVWAERAASSDEGCEVGARYFLLVRLRIMGLG